MIEDGVLGGIQSLARSRRALRVRSEAMGAQDRGLGRAAFDAVVPEVFPRDLLIFMPNELEARVAHHQVVSANGCSQPDGPGQVDLQVGGNPEGSS